MKTFKEFLIEHNYLRDNLPPGSSVEPSPEAEDRLIASKAFTDQPAALSKKSKIVMSAYRHPPIAIKIKNESIHKDHHHGGKPYGGMWYAFGNDWINFSQQMPHRIRMFVHEIKTNDNNIFIIDTNEKLLEFEKKYGYIFYYKSESQEWDYEKWIKGEIKKKPAQKIIKKYNGEKIKITKDMQDTRILINWPDVAKNYSGVEIRKSGLSGIDWQEYWDLESGCIWNQSAIKDTKLIYVYDVNKKKYVKPIKIGVYGGYSSKIKNPLPTAT